VSRLTDLIITAKAKDPQLGADIEREFRALSSRLSFGLNFERHRPEAVELPQRPVRKGDKVRVLPPRGSTSKGDQRLWLVKAIQKTSKTANLALLDSADRDIKNVSLDDLIVVVEFRDTIYPGLISTGKVSRGGDKPWHTVINGENYHALKALTWTHRGKVDAIYIDPPYNTGAKDWKYNNDYVEGDDLYRHSKWLAMMERRLLVAKELLNPSDSVLIVSIDEKEFLRLGLLLEQTFGGNTIQMISTKINAGGTGRANEFHRVDEYLFVIFFGAANLGRLEADDEEEKGLDWQTFRRRDIASRRGTIKGGPRQFYPIYVNQLTGRIEGIGDPLPHGTPRETAPVREGCIAVFPIRPDGIEMNWGTVPETCKRRWQDGYLRAGKATLEEPQQYIIQYLKGGPIGDIESGLVTITGRNPDGSVIGLYSAATGKVPTTQWSYPSHNAEHYGTGVLKCLLPGRRFPFPKSLYAVQDILYLFAKQKPNAIVLDFFAGSGTTAHAVMRLNKQDGHKRQCISITNNEVGADEQKALRERGLRPGDPEWEQWGICDYITKERVKAAINGKTPDGNFIKGDYKFTDEFSMAEGFEENAEFFTLTYETPVAVTYQTAFERIASLLWLRAGSAGRRIDKVPSTGWDVTDTYGLLVELDKATEFVKVVRKAKTLRIVYIVTDDERRFQALVRRLPENLEAVRLYESYLTNFSFSNGDNS
jgi:adenine-specific DNA-methyltransferase